MKKKLFVVSDVHGHCTILKRALEKAGFDSKNENHLLICCGDYFDRGSENVEVLKYFERLERKILLRGNHEDLLLKLLRTGKVLPHNYINGTMQTLKDFFGNYAIDPVDDTIDFSGQNRTVDRICQFIDETVDYFETEHYVFVHGWLASGCDTAEGRRLASTASWAKARWEKWTQRYSGQPPLEDKTLICGHVPTFCASSFDLNNLNADIFYGNGLVAIDAGTYNSQRINVLVLEDELIT